MNASLDAARHLVEQVATLTKVTDALREYEAEHPKLYDDAGNVLRCFGGWLSDRGINLLGDEQAAPKRKPEPAWDLGDVVQSIHTDNAYSRRLAGWWGPENVRYSDVEIDALITKGVFRVLRKQSAEVTR
jgi:hypothetical protein